MTTLLDSEISYISLEDLKKPKVCQQCHQPMTVKQINLTEACRTCFNIECNTHIMVIPEVEYIQRSYRDMEEGQDFPNALVSLEEELQKVNQLFCEVESMVSHKLSEELKNELRSISCNNRKAEDSKCVNIAKALDCDLQEGQNSTQQEGATLISDDILKTHDTSILVCNQSTFSSCASSEVTVPQFEDNAVHQYQSTSEKSNMIINEQMSGCNTLSTTSYSKNLDENLPLLSTSTFDTHNDVWQCGDQAKAGSEYVDFEPSQGISCEAHAENNLARSYNELQTSDDCLKFEFGTSELGQDKLSQSNLLDCLHGEGGRSGSDNHKERGENVDKSNSKIEVNQDCNFSANMTNTFRCYRPSRRWRRTVKEEPAEKVAVKENLLTKQSSVSDCFEFGSLDLPPDQSIKESDFCGLFADVGPDVESNSIFTPPVVSVEPLQSVNNLSYKPPLSKINIRVKVPEVGTAKSGGGYLTDSTISCRVTTKEGNSLSPKKSPPKITSTLVTKTNLVTKSQTSQMAPSADSSAPKANCKPHLGFSELKNFGGAKSSLPPPPKSKKKVPNSKKKVNGRTDSLTTVNDDIEKAIANMQQTNASEFSEWKSMFSDMF